MDRKNLINKIFLIFYPWIEITNSNSCYLFFPWNEIKEDVLILTSQFLMRKFTLIDSIINVWLF